LVGLDSDARAKQKYTWLQMFKFIVPNRTQKGQNGREYQANFKRSIKLNIASKWTAFPDAMQRPHYDG